MRDEREPCRPLAVDPPPVPQRMSSPVPGVVLVAEPPMADPNFRRTVVLLCEHTTEGSFGLVLNRPTGLTLGQAADEALQATPIRILKEVLQERARLKTPSKYETIPEFKVPAVEAGAVGYSTHDQKRRTTTTTKQDARAGASPFDS